MARELIAVDVSNPASLRGPLELALSDRGPAVFPTLVKRNAPFPSLVPDDVALVVETSGSVELPKRVMHTAESLLAAAGQTNRALGEPGLWWLTLPTHYVGGAMVVVRAIAAGTRFVTLRPRAKLTDGLVAFERDTESTSGTVPRYTSFVPKQLADLVSAAETDDSIRNSLLTFRRILVGGQRVADDLWERSLALGLPVTKTYGLAETAGGCIWDGEPLEGTRVVVAGGQITLAGPMLAKGYLDDHVRTQRAFIREEGTRWFRTADLGVLQHGLLTVTGRADRVIISGGLKVNLDEVERKFQAAHPDVSLATTGVQDPVWGEAIGVVAEEELSLSVLRDAAVEYFGPAARVAIVAVLESIPKLPSGKINRRMVSQFASSWDSKNATFLADL